VAGKAGPPASKPHAGEPEMTQSYEDDVPLTDEIPRTQEQTVPDAMTAEFSSLTTPYCWVITEDLVAGYDGAEPSAVGSYGPPGAVPADLSEALRVGKWFQLTAAEGGLAIGRLYDPSGDNDGRPLAEIEQSTWVATGIAYRQGGQWEAF
jgi:hypothetical protein